MQVLERECLVRVVDAVDEEDGLFEDLRVHGEEGEVRARHDEVSDPRPCQTLVPGLLIELCSLVIENDRGQARTGGQEGEAAVCDAGLEVSLSVQ